MPNPYTILAALLLSLALFAGGVGVGYRWEKNAHLAALATAQDATIARANADAAAELQRALASAKADAAARLASRTARLTGELDNVKKSRAQCARDLESVRLLNTAIDAANGDQPTAAVLPDPVRPGAEAGGWLGTLPAKLGIHAGGSVRPVPPPAR